MALRYLALLRYPKRENFEVPDDYQGLGLSQATRTEALHVFTNAPALPLPGRIGTIVGDLFTREERPTPVRAFTDGEARELRRTAGARLLTRYWGGYVAFIEDERGVLHILRDPSATVPCYYLKLEGAIAFSSDVDLLVEAGLLTPKPDFGFLARHLSAPDIRTPDTGLVGLKEIRAGFRMSVNGTAHIISEAWSPWAHTEPGSRSTDSALVQELQNTVLGCVGAWSRRYPRTLLGVSGGLDSSIVAASLVSAGADLTTVTLATNEAEGDERAFARILRDHLNIPLVEAFHRADLVDFTRPLCAGNR